MEAFENPLSYRLGAEFFAKLPRTPGLYFMLGRKGELLYIGKAKSLRSRLLSYRRAREGQVCDRILKLVRSIHEIRWEEHPSEAAALKRESELLHAVRPPFNVQSTEEEHYLFIGFRELGPSRFLFTLTSGDEKFALDPELFGCYRQRPKTKQCYTALLRVLAAAIAPEGKAFRFPGALCKSSPPWRYEMSFPSDWAPTLRDFLSGRSLELLRDAMERIILNDSVPRFMYPALRDDFALVREFYRFGPSATRKIREKGARGIVSRRKMDELIARQLDAALGNLRGQG